jgi:hypothetical protein
MKLLEHLRFVQEHMGATEGTLPTDIVALIAQAREAVRVVDGVLAELAGSEEGPDFLGVGKGRAR